METLWIISSAVVISIVAAMVKTRRSTPTNLGCVSRAWVMKHGMVDHTGV